MKFLTNQDTEQYQIPFTNIVPVEGYIENTKVIKLKTTLQQYLNPKKHRTLISKNKAPLKTSNDDEMISS